MMPDVSLGGYFEKHARPPAFEGSDGASYSVDVYIEEDQTANKPFAAALIFVRWSPDGTQPVGHLETEFLVHAGRRVEAKAAIHQLTLHEVKEHLEKLIERHKELPDW